MILCAHCLRGATGVEGHGDLMVEIIGSGRLRLRCRSCQAPWSRISLQDGGFAWVGIPESEALRHPGEIAVPPRAGQPAPF